MHKVHAAATPAVHHVASSLQAIHAITGYALLVAVALLVIVVIVPRLTRSAAS
jgi:hypothetical protein